MDTYLKTHIILNCVKSSCTYFRLRKKIKKKTLKFYIDMTWGYQINIILLMFKHSILYIVLVNLFVSLTTSNYDNNALKYFSQHYAVSKVHFHQ